MIYPFVSDVFVQVNVILQIVSDVINCKNETVVRLLGIYGILADKGNAIKHQEC